MLYSCCIFPPKPAAQYLTPTFMKHISPFGDSCFFFYFSDTARTPTHLQVILHILGIKAALCWGFPGPLTGSGHLPALVGHVSLTTLTESPSLQPGPSQGLQSMRTIPFWLRSSEEWGGLWRQMYQTVREPVSKSAVPAAGFTQTCSPKFSKSTLMVCTWGRF